MFFVDLDVARRVESAQAKVCLEYARAVIRRRPDRGDAVEPIGGGYAVFTGIGSPISQATAVGMGGPVAESDLERLESFYFERGCPAKVLVCPMADPGVGDWLGRRGYRPVEFENVLVRPLDLVEPAPPLPPEMVVRRAGPDEAELYVSTVVTGFFEGGEVTPDLFEQFLLGFHAEGACAFLVELDGRPVSGGSVALHDGVATLCGASTLPPSRNRGAQTALHHARLAFAATAGCDLAVINTNCGTVSQRNSERRGFRVAYTRVGFQREPS
jgi:hypothetical protein